MEADYTTTRPPAAVNKVAAELVLDETHLSIFERALSNVLATEIAQETFAQIVDGLPLAKVAFSIRGRRDTIYDPVFKHKELCDGVLDKTRSFREDFLPARLELGDDVLRRYQCAPVGCQVFKVILVELVVRAVHEIGVLLYQLDDTFHKGQDLVGKAPPVEISTDDDDEDFGFPTIEAPPPFPTPFTLAPYSDPDQYTEGIAALPGYWAEDRIFGGVVLFQRGSNETTRSDDIWYHSSRENVTRRIYALTDEQKKSLLDFLQSDGVQGPEAPGPLPILGDRHNRRRVDTEIAIPEHKIFRDRWERKVTVRSYHDYMMRRKDVRTPLDYPELEDGSDGTLGARVEEHPCEYVEPSDVESSEVGKVGS